MKSYTEESIPVIIFNCNFQKILLKENVLNIVGLLYSPTARKYSLILLYHQALGHSINPQAIIRNHTGQKDSKKENEEHYLNNLGYMDIGMVPKALRLTV